MKRVRVYPYRWIMLLAVMLVSIASQVQWFSLAPVSRVASHWYKGQIPEGSLVGPDLLTLAYLAVFFVFSIPASYVIDKIKLAWSLRLGSLSIAVFSVLKGVWADSFLVVLLAQVGLAIAHPLVLNSITAVTARWFPLRERGFAAGLVTLSQYAGILLVMVVSPQVVSGNPHAPDYGNGIASLLFWYGICCAMVSIAAVFLFRESPPSPASLEPYEDIGFVRSFLLLTGKKHMRGFMMIYGLLWAVFNVFISKIDGIAALIGIENSNGLLGVVLLMGGMLGSVIFPMLSDYLRKRKVFFCISTAGVFVSFLVFALSPVTLENLVHPQRLAIVFSGVLGFFLMSAFPLGFQYAAELSYPVQESASQGVLLQMGHLIGIVVLLFMSIGGGMYLEEVLVVGVTLLFTAFLGALFIKESPVIVTEDERLREAIGKEIVHH